MNEGCDFENHLGFPYWTKCSVQLTFATVLKQHWDSLKKMIISLFTLKMLLSVGFIIQWTEGTERNRGQHPNTLFNHLLVLTLGWMASFWLTSWDLKMRTSSLRTSSSSLTEVSCSIRTRYAGAPGAVTSGALFSLRALRNSFSSFFSFLFSDSSSWRCVKRQRIVHCSHPQLYTGMLGFPWDGRRVLLEKIIRATLVNVFPGSPGTLLCKLRKSDIEWNVAR